MTSMALGRRNRVRTIITLGCALGALVPTVAFAQQSPTCAKASLLAATHNKDAPKFAAQCAAEPKSVPRRGQSSNQGAADQAAQRQAILERRRQELLEQQRQQDLQQRQQQQRQQQQRPQSGSPTASASNPNDLGGLMQRIRAEQQRRQAMQQQRQAMQQQRQAMQQQRQAQSQGYPFAPAPAPAPALPPYAATAAAPAASPAPPPAPSAGVTLADLEAQGAPVTDPLSPGPRNPSLVNDQAVAKRSKTDLGVFGVSLGEPLALLPCAQFAAGAPDPCVAEGGVPALVATMFSDRVARVSGFRNVPVQLPAAQCPDWLKAGSCTVVLAMRDGYSYAAFMVAGGEDFQGIVETQLNQKYSKSADKGQPSSCSKDPSAANRQSPPRVWSMRGLRVAYDPLGARCAFSGWRRGSGQIILETDTFQHLTRDANHVRDAGQPKM